MFGLQQQWRARVTDSRVHPVIPTHVFPAAFFALFSARFPSFNSFAQHRSSSSLRRWLGAHALPSADELAFAAERIDPAGLRGCLGHLHATLKRNKVIAPRHGWTLAAVDGHEINASYKRCCAHCCQRRIRVGGEERIQFYHRVVVFQIISEGFYLLLDLEPILPGEDEVAAALRLIARVLAGHPRSFDIVTADATYMRPSVIGALQAHGKHLIAVIKDNQPELLQEARALLAQEAPECFATARAPGRSARQVELRQADGFTTESIRTPLRAVHAHERGVRRERSNGEWIETPVESHWYWATTMPGALAPGRTIFEFGHDRWRIENEGFNELVSAWHSRHIFHHESNSMVVMWLMLFMAHAVFHCFHQRNLKPAQRQGHSVIYFAELLAASFRIERWWPPPPA